jgi:peptidoglycan/LPS O-acetylase OafA/YrhL
VRRPDPALDGVRGLAVVAVVAYHTHQLIASGATGPAAALFRAGRLGVDLFFVLSGFLLFSSWKSLRSRNPGARAFLTFARRRILRIVPAYWISLVVLVPLVAPELLRTVHGLGNLALLATFQQYLNPHLPARVNVVYWSLTTEVHFYLLLPFLALAFRRFGAWRTLCGCLALSALWRLGLKSDLPAGWIFGRIDEFVAGMAAASLVSAYRHGTGGVVARALTRRRAGVALGVAFAGAALVNGVDRWRVVSQPVVGLLVAALLARALCLRRVAWLEHRALQFAGATSYSLYLWHRPVLLAGLQLTPVVFPGAPVVTALTLAVLVSFVSYALVERPFLARKESTRKVVTASHSSAVSAPVPASNPWGAPAISR